MLNTTTKKIIADELKKATDISFEDVMSDVRTQEFVKARHIFFWFLYNYEQMSYSSIGRFANRDHTTVSSSVKKVENDGHLKKCAVVFLNNVKKRYGKIY